MQPQAKDAGLRVPQECTRGTSTPEAPKPGWALTLEGLAALRPEQRHHQLLFGDLLEDVGAAASIFPRESVELANRMPDPRAWTQSVELPAERQDRLLGVLKAAEARGRIRALRLRYTRMRAEEISLLILQQKSARAAIRLELFLPPQLKPTRIRDPLDRQEVPASPGGGGEGAPPASPPPGPSPSPRSGGAWRPSWRRKSMAASSRVDGDPTARERAPPSHIKFSFSRCPLVFPLPLSRSTEKEGGSVVAASPTSDATDIWDGSQPWLPGQAPAVWTPAFCLLGKY
uniref:LKAAEAR motif containing 1 n=1 Tax=Equus caballus TaxID=9796 RepID=F6Q2P4_HORSE